MDQGLKPDYIAEMILDYRDTLRKCLLKYTRRAYSSLPAVTAPRILDVGCGSGVPSVELAEISGGKITAIDNDMAMLVRLKKKAIKAGLLGRFTIIRCSMLEMDFADESFDIIWAEGSIAIIGFEKGLREWRRLVKQDGFLIVHDDQSDQEIKGPIIHQCGYDLIESFILDNGVWWNEYYAPLAEKLKEIRQQYPGNKVVNVVLQSDQAEVDGYALQPGRYRSVFYIMQKR